MQIERMGGRGTKPTLLSALRPREPMMRKTRRRAYYMPHCKPSRADGPFFFSFMLSSCRPRHPIDALACYQSRDNGPGAWTGPQNKIQRYMIPRPLFHPALCLGLDLIVAALLLLRLESRSGWSGLRRDAAAAFISGHAFSMSPL